MSGANVAESGNGWWRDTYGDPCRECGFEWSEPAYGLIAVVETVPARFAALLADTAGDEVPPGCTWSAKAYVFHVADNLRVFAERLEGVRAGGPRALVGYDENELAAARRYEEMSLAAALWSVVDAVPRWATASRGALAAGTTFTHSERGDLTAAEIVRAPAHDALHHVWDVSRAVSRGGG